MSDDKEWRLQYEQKGKNQREEESHELAELEAERERGERIIQERTAEIASAN